MKDDEKKNEKDCSCVSECYKPVKIHHGLNKHVRRSLAIGVNVSICLLWAVLLSLAFSSILAPKDPTVMLRWVDERIIRMGIAFLTLVWAILLFEVKYNGNLVGRILSDAIACAITLGCMVLGIVLLLIAG